MYDYEFTELILFFLVFINLIQLLGLILIKNNDFFKVINIQTGKLDFGDKLILVVSVIVIAISVNLLSNLELPGTVNLMEILGACMLFFIVLIVFLIITESYRKDLFFVDLESFEYEIYIRDLSDEEIRSILQKKYMGFLISDWIEIKKQEILNDKKSFKVEEDLISMKQSELIKIDKEKYPLEYEGREKELHNLKEELKKRKSESAEKHKEEIVEIISKKAWIEDNEVAALNLLKSQLEFD